MLKIEKGRYQSCLFKSNLRCFPAQVACQLQRPRLRHPGLSQASRTLLVMKRTTCGILLLGVLAHHECSPWLHRYLREEICAKMALS